MDSILTQIVKIDDNKKMLKQIMEFPMLIREGLKVDVEINIDSGDVKKIFWYGMGASALVGEYIKAIINFGIKKNIDFKVHRANFDRRSLDSDLIIIYTYSGNTYETVQALLKIIETNAKKRVIVFSSGGKARDIAKREGLLYVRLIGGYVSRSHLPFGVAVASKVLYEITKFEKLLDFGDYQKYLREILNNNELLEAVINFTKTLPEKIPIILADYALYPLGKRFIAQLNENAKNMAMYFEVPEGGHNFIVGLRDIKSKIAVLILRRQSEDEFVKRYINIISELLEPAYKLIFKVKDESLSWKTYLQPTLLIDIISVLLAENKNKRSFDIEEIVRIKEFLSR